ncbi:MAG: radical SAM/SPASM domain-containing protein [Nitrososphaerota archaeon]
MKIIQIEVTSRCNAFCIMCPKSCMGELWNSGDLPMDVYRRMSEYFDLFDLIWLQGWGEPLLVKEIFDMVRLAGKVHGSVGLTTNAMLLNEDFSRKLIESGLRVIAISIAGATEKTHENIRRGTIFKKIVENVETLTRLRRSMNAKDLKVIFTFLRIKQNIRELPDVVELAASLDVDEVVGTNLDYIPTREHYDMKIFFEEKPPEEYLEIIRESEEKAKENGISIYNYPVKMDEVAICSENPIENLYVCHDGTVSPCVYLNIPLKTNIFPRYFKGKTYTTEKYIFGDLKKEELTKIIEKRECRDFREIYRKRSEYTSSGSLLSKLMNFGEKPTYPRLPKQCWNCYKAYGV